MKTLTRQGKDTIIEKEYDAEVILCIHSGKRVKGKVTVSKTIMNFVEETTNTSFQCDGIITIDIVCTWNTESEPVYATIGSELEVVLFIKNMIMFMRTLILSKEKEDKVVMYLRGNSVPIIGIKDESLLNQLLK